MLFVAFRFHYTSLYLYTLKKELQLIGKRIGVKLIKNSFFLIPFFGVKVLFLGCDYITFHLKE